MGNDVFGKTIGIVGLGNVGSRISQLCGGLFSMRVLAYDPYLTAAEIAARGAQKVALAELMARADFVSINCPLSDETRGMIGAREYALMQPHAIFITRFPPIEYPAKKISGSESRPMSSNRTAR